MKNLLFASLLINPLNSVTVAELGNDIITTCRLGKENGTNASQTYSRTSNPQDWQGDSPPQYVGYEVTQKFNDNAPQNNYANFVIYNYCGLEYEMIQDDNDFLGYHTFVIIQYTPYNTISSSQVDITINLNNNMSDLTQGYETTNYNLKYTVATTTTDLGNLLNTSNWTDINKSREVDPSNSPQITTYWEQAYTQNINKTTIAQYNGAITPESTYIYGFTINNVNLKSKTTQYIIMQYTLDLAIISENQELLKTINDPDENTLLLHTNNVEITSAKNNVTYTQEIVDIPGLMFTILGLPFSFISQAFDLTIFPGTPYQVNFSNIFLGFIAIAMLLWVLKLILGQADIGQWLGDQKRMHREERLRDRNHKRNMQRNEEHNKNRHEELAQKERLAHERAQKHKGNR